MAFFKHVKALILDKSTAYAYTERGLLERRFINYNSAINYFNLAILQSTKWVFPLSNLTGSYTSIGNNELAIQTGLKAIAVDPNSAVANYNLANAYQRNSNWRKATE